MNIEAKIGLRLILNKIHTRVLIVDIHGLENRYGKSELEDDRKLTQFLY